MKFFPVLKRDVTPHDLQCSALVQAFGLTLSKSNAPSADEPLPIFKDSKQALSDRSSGHCLLSSGKNTLFVQLKIHSFSGSFVALLTHIGVVLEP